MKNYHKLTKTNEVCPHCGADCSYSIKNMIQKCKYCKKFIILCSICKKHNCGNCEFDEQIKELNREAKNAK